MSFLIPLLVGIIIGGVLMMRYADKHYCQGVWDKEKEVRLTQLEAEKTRLETTIARNQLTAEKILTRRIKEAGNLE